MKKDEIKDEIKAELLELLEEGEQLRKLGFWKGYFRKNDFLRNAGLLQFYAELWDVIVANEPQKED